MLLAFPVAIAVALSLATAQLPPKFLEAST
jgi:hypothetical protein